MDPPAALVERPPSDADVSSEAPMRLLMVTHLPWSKELGAAKVQVELAEEIRALGHHVDAFCVTDAFPDPPRGRGATYVRHQLFPARARAYIRGAVHRYDVIDTLQSSLPYSKRSLGFDGLLVTRSTGLYRFYDDWQRLQRKRWPDTWAGHPVGRVLRQRKARVSRRRSHGTLEHADLISLLNRHELRYVQEETTWGDKATLLQHGLSRNRFLAFDFWRAPVRERLRNQEVAFIGQWSPRKGARDLGEIVARVMQRVPGARFSFLGTGQPADVVLRDLGFGAGHSIRVVPEYRSQDLPEMLSGATIGCLPTYLEGFPFSILEQLAAGLPTVAYDVPGPGETLEQLDPSLLVPPGANEAFAARICDLLESDADRYAALVDRTVSVAKRFRWERIAAETVDVYAASLEALRRRG